MYIIAMHPAGFVYGADGYSNCGGGSQVIWSDQSGEWDIATATQDIFDCYELAALGLPEEVGALDCYADGQAWYY